MLDDAVWERNTKVEEALNFTLKEIERPYTAWATSQQEMCDSVINSVLAGDQEYDAAYLPVSFKPGTITEGYLLDLYTVPGLQLEEEWWDNALNESMELNGKLYSASSPLNLFSLDMADVLLFNKGLLTDYKIDYPYEKVLDGTWTIDAMHEDVTKLANLNGDETFALSESGNSTYGIAAHRDFPIAFVLAAGNRMVEKNNDGTYTINIDKERWYNTIDKLAALFTVDAGHAFFDNAVASPTNYEKMFSKGRAGYITCEMKTVTVLRSTMDKPFGLIPMPKYDENQEDYRVAVSYNTAFLTVPKIQDDLERTGTILDVLSYESKEMTLPIYNEISLTQKGLRDDESAEMLKIINKSLGIEFSQIYGITNAFVSAINPTMMTTNPNPASIAATHLPVIQANIDKVLSALN